LRAPNSGRVQQVQQNSNQKPKVAGIVFAISGIEALQSDNIVRDICSILGTQLYVLFDFGVTHSFISFDCAKKLSNEFSISAIYNYFSLLFC